MATWSGIRGSMMPCLLRWGGWTSALQRVMEAVRQAGGIMLISADHGNADDMYEHDEKTGKVKTDKEGRPQRKTSHSLNPVPCIIYDPETKASMTAILMKGLG